MTTFFAWLPDIICGLVVVLYVVAIKKFFTTIRGYSAVGVGLLVLVATAVIVSYIWRAFFIDANPSLHYAYETRTTNTAIIFGFGYEQGDKDAIFCSGNDKNVKDTILLLPDASNVALYRQATSNTNYQILIMQEGVMAAACSDTVHRKIRMHPHREEQYINTLSAARYALLKMDSLRVKKAVVYAHHQQLARAVYCLNRVASSDPQNPQWREMQFITPYVPPTPFPRYPKHRHTKYEFIYLPVEIFYSRPWNTIARY